jgi:N-acyl-L-homoserine lactone synthetase
VEKLGWDLTTENDLETDQFDTHRSVYAAIYSGKDVVGSFRAIKADAPYLAKTVFPQLATTRPYPVRSDYWEISRFGAWPGSHFLGVSSLLYALMFRFALMHQAKSLVAVTDLIHERYLTKRAIRTRRFGSPVNFPCERHPKGFTLVAGEILVRDQSKIHLANMLSYLDGVTVNDTTLVLGRSRLQA